MGNRNDFPAQSVAFLADEESSGRGGVGAGEPAPFSRREKVASLFSLCENVLADSHSPAARAHRCAGGGAPAWRQPPNADFFINDGGSMSSSDGGSSGGQRGRPKKDPADRRTISHGLKLSQKEKDQLERNAGAAGLSVNEYLRRKALGGKSVSAKSDQETRTELRDIGNNLNQLARAANMGNLEEVAEAVQSGIKDLREALKRLE